MKKVIRLTESDLYKIVKRVLKEQSLDYDYFFKRDTGATDVSGTYSTIYFKKDGDSYLVFGDKGEGIIKGLGIKVPTISQLGLSVQGGVIKYNGSVGDAVYIANLITPSLDTYNKESKLGIFVDKNGIPSKGSINKLTVPIKQALDKEGGEGHQVKDGEVAIGKDYFIIDKKGYGGYGSGMQINVGVESQADKV
jgi:hypothetical protein